MSPREAAVAARFAAAEAERSRFVAGLEPNPARIATGWERRFAIEGPRAREAIVLYRAMGFEAESDPLTRADLPDGCESCQLAALLGLPDQTERRPFLGKVACHTPCLPVVFYQA